MGFLVFRFTYLISDFHSLLYVQNKYDLSSCSLKSSSDITWAFLQEASAPSTLFTMISHLDVKCLLWYYQTTEVFNAHILFLVSFFFLLSGDLLISSLGFLILILQHLSEFFPIVKRLLWQIWPILDFPSCKSYHFYIVIVFCDIIYNIFTSLFCCFTCSKSYVNSRGNINVVHMYTGSAEAKSVCHGSTTGLKGTSTLFMLSLHPIQKNPLEKEGVTHSSSLSWGIPWAGEPGGLQSMVFAKSWAWLST